MSDSVNLRPKVSVCVISYNQVQYIRECVQSIVEQDTDFDFEVVVGDDCSTDGTREILAELACKYPSIIRTIFQAKRTGGSKNFLDVHAAARGEYVAHVDGDDYCLPGKLRAQVDYLDKNPECAIAWHRMYIMDVRTGRKQKDNINFALLPQRFFREDIVQFVTIGLHSSKMYRSARISIDYPNFPILDFHANVEHIGNGFAAIIADEPYGVYRVGVGQASTGNETRLVLQKSYIYFADKYAFLKPHIAAGSLFLMLAAVKNRRWQHVSIFMRVFIRCFRVRSIVLLWQKRNIYRMFGFPREISNPLQEPGKRK